MEANRVLAIENGVNFRQLGGYQNEAGRSIKWNKLIRSGKLANLSKSDLALLEQLNVKFDVDFRSPEEKHEAPDLVPSTAEYIFDPVFEIDETQSTKQTRDLSNKMKTNPLTGKNEMIRVYQDIIKKSHTQKAYRRFFDILLSNDQESDSLLFHCTAGKDRTGMGAIFLMSALDIPEDTIKADYLLTNRVAADFQRNVVMDLKLKHEPSAYIQSIKALQSVQIAYYNAAMDEIKQIAGSMKQYLHDYLELSDSEVRDLKEIYLTK